MSIVAQIKQVTAQAITSLYNIELQPSDILINATKPEFEGDYTVVLFAFVKTAEKNHPIALGQELGNELVAKNPELFSAFNIIKGFLNLSINEKLLAAVCTTTI